MATPVPTLDKLRGMDSSPAPQIGLPYWMKQVLVRADDAAQNFSSGSVHALRTSLRRCRSMADGIRVFDADPAWKKMRRAGKELFSSLGALRDTHVMIEWIEKLFASHDPSAAKLLSLLRERERQQRQSAIESLEHFDRKQWEKWLAELPARTIRIPPDSPVFAHLAVERWHEAHLLHSRAMRNRSSHAFHDLRIGIKHFRYTIENFLPTRHQTWGDSLKSVQDLLGEVHDLDVLWQTAVGARIFADAEARLLWRTHISAERAKRIEVYRKTMVGRHSEWLKWREGLPSEEQLRPLAQERVEIWASFMDPDFTHARHVVRLAQQLYQTMPSNGIVRASGRKAAGDILQSAALMHEAGRSRSNRGYHKTSARMIRKLASPRGMRSVELRLAALVARYHRGALPRETQARYAALAASRRKLVQFLAGILRLACACDRAHDARIHSLSLDSSTPVWTLIADGYDAAAPFAEHLAAARHLLELACGHPILIVPAGRPASRAA